MHLPSKLPLCVVTLISDVSVELFTLAATLAKIWDEITALSQAAEVMV